MNVGKYVVRDVHQISDGMYLFLIILFVYLELFLLTTLLLVLLLIIT